jgi:hypothetical protein
MIGGSMPQSVTHVKRQPNRALTIAVVCGIPPRHGITTDSRGQHWILPATT